jgi:uncharacterized sulfatase
MMKSTCWILLLFTLVIFSFQAQSQSPRKMNVLFIAVDDLNNCLGCYGHPMVKSPNIDRLAKRGIRFDRAYCQYPLCNPSRTSFLSGRRPDVTQIFQNTVPPRTTLKDVVFLPEYFRQHGYFTAGVGKIAHGRFANAVKWDVYAEPARGREDADEVREGARRRPPAAAGARQIWRATNDRDEDEPDGKVARRIAQLLEQNKDKPFFIAAGFHKPHLDWVAPKKYFDLYPPDQIVLPKEPADDRKDVPAAALNRNPNFASITDEQKRQQAIAAYYACTTFMDAQVGVVLDALDRLKLWDNTIVVFFGDHGFHLGEHGGLWAKVSLFEESARVPLIIAAPGKKSGVASPRLVELVDLYPTLTQLCGLPTPEGMEGVSLARLLEDPDRPWKTTAFTQVQRGQNRMGRSVRTERYRYTEWDDGKAGAELYDHDADPHEYVNLVNDPKHTKTVEEMKRLLREGWRRAAPPLGDGRKRKTE